MKLKSGLGQRTFVCFICFCFFLLASGFPGLMVQAKEKGLSIGEMISRGEVKFEAREKVWKAVAPFHFPVFQGMKVKTEKGVAALVLGTNTQVELTEHSILSIDDADRITLLQGRVDFRIPSGVELNFKVGTLSVTKSRNLQTSKVPLTVPTNEETIGSITLHGNGAATVKSHQGSVSIVKQGQVLAALSSKGMTTIPSVTVSGDSKTKTAQAGASDSASAGSKSEKPAGDATKDSDLLLGIPLWGWGVALGGLGALGAIVAVSAKGDDHHAAPLCR